MLFHLCHELWKYQDLRVFSNIVLKTEITTQKEFSHSKPIIINPTLLAWFVKSASLHNFLPINNRRSIMYMTSLVATIEIVFPDYPALAVLPERWINILGFGGKSY
jgi:hypothetical protein